MISLSDSINSIPQISDSYEELFEKLSIRNIKDLLTYFPRKYTNNLELNTINEAFTAPDPQKIYQFRAKVINIKSVRLRTRKTLQNGLAIDESGEIKCMWFNQPYLTKVFREDKEYFLTGRIKPQGKKIIFYPNLYEEVNEDKDSVHLNRITPEYSLTEGLSRKWFRNRMKWLIDNIERVDFERDELFENNLTNRPLGDNIKSIHFPESEDDFFQAIKSVSLYELCDIFLKLFEKKSKKKVLPPPQIGLHEKEVGELLENLPYKLTNDQLKAIESIDERLEKNEVIDLLIQGDVGSGKTIVAMIAALKTAISGFQCIVLSPTTILAKQHFNTFSEILKPFDLKVQLVIGETPKENINNADIIIGTTAVLARKKLNISKPGLIIVDEQHKFGVYQREELINDHLVNNLEYSPHLINMSATPIPRSVVQVFFGEIDVIRIVEKPSQRLPIKTRLISKEKRDTSIKWIESEIKSKSIQVYWVCSLIDSDKDETRTIEDVYKELRKKFSKEIKIERLTGKMKDKDKLEVSRKFKSGDIDILIATTVIEVGVDVPNATIMVIEDADKFGLSQLHQIRGRVGRGDKESWCFLYPSEKISENGQKRLKFFVENDDGFRIAEFDLENRGPGEIYGVQQAGIPNLKIANLGDAELIRESKVIAETLYNKGINDIKFF